MNNNIGVNIKLMEIEDHYSQLLGTQAPWEIGKIDLDMSAHRVDIQIEYTDVGKPKSGFAAIGAARGR